MDDFLLGASIVLFLASLVLPIVLFFLVYYTRKRLRVVEQSLEQRERELRYLYEQVKAGKPATPAVPQEPLPADSPPEPAVVPDEALDGGPTAPATPADPDPGEATKPPTEPMEPVEPVQPAAPAAPVEPPKPKQPLEQRLATLFTRVGAGALLLGLLYFFKYAVDNEWIGPMGRVLVGTVAGLSILGLAELIRSRTRAAYVHAVIGVGLACLFISAYASSAFYQLVPTEIAFAANAVILLLGAALAWRHRGEAILVLVSIAGFLNPVLLSTGEDRPFALFAYLLVMTSVALLVATHHGFRFAIIVSILGSGILFGGWYERFFDTHDLRGYGDRPPDELLGPYFHLPSRIVPLGAVALFTVQWLGVAFRLRRVDLLPRFVKPVAIAALVLGHAGMTALLFDHPIPLGIVMIVLGAGAVVALRALDGTRYLLVPMLVAFVLVLGLTEKARDWNQIAVVALFGVWTAVYVIAFLRDLSIQHETLSSGQAVRASIAIYAFAILASAMLLPNEKPIVAELALTGAAAALAVIAYRARLPGLTLATLLLTLIPMGVAVYLAREDAGYYSPAALGVAFLWTAAVAAAPMATAVLRKEATRLDLFDLCLSTLAFVALGIAGTSEETPTLRALITATGGAINLAVATHLALSRTQQSWVTVLAALTLGLFAPAVAFGLSGATITVLWAVLALVAALILSQTKDRVWLATLGILALATLTRVFAVDVPHAEHLLSEFVYTQGRRGVLAFPAFFNFRSYAFFGTGFAFLGGAFFLRSQQQKIAAGLSVVAYALLTTVLVVEVRSALLELPPVPPILLDSQEFNVFINSVRAAKAAQHNLLAMASTVVLAAVGTVLLGIGFLAKDAFHRYLGLAVFLGTVGKLVVWDVWNLERIYQVVALTVVGALLLGSGFLYARLRGLFKGTVASVLFLALAGSAEAQTDAPAAEPVPVHVFTHRRAIQGVKEAGDHAVTVDAALYRASTARGLLEDVRIADERGRVIPHVVRFVEPPEIPRYERARMFDPGETPDGTYRATFEVPEGMEHCEIRLILHGPAPYLRRTRIETGDSTDDMQLVAEGALVWALMNSSGSTIRYPRSIAKFARVSLLPDPDAATTRIAGAEIGCDGPRSVPPFQRIPIEVVRVERDEASKRTVVELDAGTEGVPLETIHLEISTPEFVRRTTLAASSYRSVWPQVSHAVLYRYAGANRPANLSLSAGGTTKRYFQLTIEDGDDAPLDISGAHGRARVREIVFRTTQPGAHTLYVGDKDALQPHYDLEEILQRGTPAPARPASLGALEPNPDHGAPKVPDDLPITEKHRTPIGIGLAVVLLLLAAWAVRLIRSGPK